MKKTMLALVGAASALAAMTATAQAAGGCGPGFHRGHYGACRPNFGPGPGYGPGPVVGTFYPGHGYWWGGRYYGHRRFYGGGWRYY